MNKKFKKLANKAGFTSCTKRMQTMLEAYGNEVVDECVAIIPETMGNDRGTYRDQLKEHFRTDNVESQQ